MTHSTSARDVVEAVKDVDFPAGKDTLIEEASRKGAPPDVVKALRGIPAEQYANREEVARSVRVDPDSDLGLSPAQRDRSRAVTGQLKGSASPRPTRLR